MKKIYIIFSRVNSITSKVISKVSNFDYSHICISFDNEFNNMYTFSRKYNITPIFGCYKIEDINKGLYLNDGKLAIFSIEICDSKYMKLKKLVNKFKYTNSSYNMIGAALLPLKLYINRKNKYFCSQFVSELLQICDIYMFNKKTNSILPSDIYKINILKKEYEGNIREYKEILYE